MGPWWLTWHLCLYICEKCEMSRLWHTNTRTDTRTVESSAVFSLSWIRKNNLDQDKRYKKLYRLISCALKNMNARNKRSIWNKLFHDDIWLQQKLFDTSCLDRAVCNWTCSVQLFFYSARFVAIQQKTRSIPRTEMNKGRTSKLEMSLSKRNLK